MWKESTNENISNIFFINISIVKKISFSFSVGSLWITRNVKNCKRTYIISKLTFESSSRDLFFRVNTEVPKCQTTVQANSISMYVYIDILFACFGSFAFRYPGSATTLFFFHYLRSIIYLLRNLWTQRGPERGSCKSILWSLGEPRQRRSYMEAPWIQKQNTLMHSNVTTEHVLPALFTHLNISLF